MVKSTYLYFVGSLGITASSAYYLSKTSAVHRMMKGNPWLVRLFCDIFNFQFLKFFINKAIK